MISDQIALHSVQLNGRRGGLMVSALDSGASGPGSNPGRGHCVVILAKTLYFLVIAVVLPLLSIFA